MWCGVCVLCLVWCGVCGVSGVVYCVVGEWYIWCGVVWCVVGVGGVCVVCLV